ncbi:transporter substrate-binding domain-containing protein [Pseudodesulfovibrio sp. zrk46]|uniref:substrate-binding periplasmic protein n=1 Tax=Pseudodesulfovibrio sp. zrk46 TaxID=2725288 RepID=UPI0014493F5C|nr:transporter substrate-binding domain-containing protein [Pseudodesulfovibrio sp. zrk46]QJB56192.1 amino acid ABC transporter substrate-binding protein [Pseudodesulfovibrio sp. zrk46]
MGRFLWATLFIFLVFLGLTAHAAEPLKMCVDDWPPYEYKENYQIEGICVKAAKAVLERMGHGECSLVSANWERCLNNVRIGDDHLALTAVKTSEREQYAWYPDEPLTTAYRVFFVKTDRRKVLRYRSLEDLNGRRIGLVKGFHYPPEIVAYAEKHATIRYAADPTTNFHLLLDDRVDFVFEDLAPGMYILEQLHAKDKAIPLLDSVLEEEPLYVIFSKERVDKVFVDRFSKELERYKQTDEYKKIFSQYDPWVKLPHENEN